MKPKTLILMVVAVVCGLGASYLTSRVLAERTSQPPPEPEKVQVLVAKQKIPIGVLVKEPEKYFVWKSFTKGEEPKKALTSMDQVKDRRMNKPLAEEQFVTAEDLMDPKSGSLDTLLPQGMRAIAVKVNAASSVSGFVQPNCRVDVVSTVRQGDESFSQIILQNMLVLAADMQSQRDPEKQASISSTVTMAAKPEDAQKLRLAEAMGELSLILRGAEDDQNLRVKPIKPRDVVRSTDGSVEAATGEEPAAVGGAAPPLIGVPDVPTPTKPTETAAAPDKAPPPTPAPAPRTVAQVIYNGETVTKTVFILNDDGNVVTRVEKTGMEREPRPEKKEKEPGKSEKEKSEPEAKKDGDKKEGDKEPAAKTDGTK